MHFEVVAPNFCPIHVCQHLVNFNIVVGPVTCGVLLEAEISVRFSRRSTNSLSLSLSLSLSDSFIIHSVLLRQGNAIQTIPPSVSALADSLTNMNMHTNKLTVLPPQMGDLRLLTHLNIANNKITHLPLELAKCTQLIVLKVDRNQIQEFPAPLTMFTKLKSLDISDNALASLPSTIGNLCSLEELRANDNNLVTIPESISRLANLRVLEVDKNKIVQIPQSVGTLPLTELNLADNPLRYPPHPVVVRLLSRLLASPSLHALLLLLCVFSPALHALLLLLSVFSPSLCPSASTSLLSLITISGITLWRNFAALLAVQRWNAASYLLKRESGTLHCVCVCVCSPHCCAS